MPTNTNPITAATGCQGGAAVRLLLKQCKMVHALVPNADSPASHKLWKLGVVLLQGDFDSTGAIKDAIQGMDGIFHNSFLHPKHQQKGCESAISVDTAKAAGTKTIVASTVFHTERPGLWQEREEMKNCYRAKAAVEDVVCSSGQESRTILRPPTIMHNFLKPDTQWQYPELATGGILADDFDPNAWTPYLDAADVG